jgi:hypothetical protein
VESAQIAQDSSNGKSTARLKGIGEVFEFGGKNDISFDRYCYGMDYPAQSWPTDCTIDFSGPAIDAAYGTGARLSCIKQETCAVQVKK